MRKPRFEWRGIDLFDNAEHDLVAQRRGPELWITDHGATILAELLNQWSLWRDERLAATLEPRS